MIDQRPPRNSTAISSIFTRSFSSEGNIGRLRRFIRIFIIHLAAPFVSINFPGLNFHCRIERESHFSHGL